MNQNPLRKLESYGQSIWIDFLRRGVLSSGEMRGWIEEDGVAGVTSNPSIFEKAFAESHDYDEDIDRLRSAGRRPEDIYGLLTVDDIQRTADLFRPVFDHTGGADGFVSLEVSPLLANDTQGSITEARQLWKLVNRPNLMVKIPGTAAGLPAIRQLISEGINVNVTLLFGIPRYQEVMDAYFSGLERRLSDGQPIQGISSVASFFLSRIDVLLDPMLEKISSGGDPRKSRLARDLHGQMAIASAKIAYQIYTQVIQTPRWRDLEAQGARRQRLLWASTSTKNPEYSDVKYVEPLIGPETINTMPVETLEAYRDHGNPADRLQEGQDEASKQMELLQELGINIDDITNQLEREGVEKFNKSYDQLLKRLAEKVQARS